MMISVCISIICWPVSLNPQQYLKSSSGTFPKIGGMEMGRWLLLITVPSPFRRFSATSLKSSFMIPCPHILCHVIYLTPINQDFVLVIQQLTNCFPSRIQSPRHLNAIPLWKCAPFILIFPKLLSGYGLMAYLQTKAIWRFRTTSILFKVFCLIESSELCWMESALPREIYGRECPQWFYLRTIILSCIYKWSLLIWNVLHLIYILVYGCPRA